MKATLNIYNSIEDAEPSKVYTCYRLTMEIDNKLNELLEETNEISEVVNKKAATLKPTATREETKKLQKEIQPLQEKLSELTLETIRLFFPSFTVEEFNKLDPYEYQTFIFDIGAMRDRIFNRAAKN